MQQKKVIEKEREVRGCFFSNSTAWIAFNFLGLKGRICKSWFVFFLITYVLLFHIKVLSNLLQTELQKEVQIQQSQQQQLCDALAVLRANIEVGFNLSCGSRMLVWLLICHKLITENSFVLQNPQKGAFEFFVKTKHLNYIE